MDPFRLTGFVYPVKKNGVPVRGRWQLWVNLPPEPAFDRDRQPVLDSKGRQKQKYPKTTKVVEAKGKKAAERLLETWIAELEAHRSIDPDRLRVWLAAQKEYRLAQGPAWNEAGRVVPKKEGTQMAPSTVKSQWWSWVARQRIDPHLPIHGLRDSFGTWVYETYGVKQAQEWLGHSDPATTLRHCVRLTTAARARAVAGLDEVTRAALARAEEKVAEDAGPSFDNVVALATRRR